MQGKAAFIGRTVTIALAMSISACSAQQATKASAAGETSANACDVVRDWQATGKDAERRIVPAVSAGDGNTTYRFAPAATPVASLTATCGNAPYSECEVSVALRDGTGYSFTELSRFALMQAGDDLWMVYRLQSTGSEADRGKRRIVKVARDPATLCNEIGDYSDVM